MKIRVALLTLWLSSSALTLLAQPLKMPLMRVVDLNVGEPASEVILHDGTKARIELLSRSKVSDSIRGAVRHVRVRVKVNSQEVQLECGNYNLPVSCRRCPGRLCRDERLSQQQPDRSMGSREGCPVEIVAGRLSVHGSWHVHLPRETALVCDHHSDV